MLTMCRGPVSREYIKVKIQQQLYIMFSQFDMYCLHQGAYSDTDGSVCFYAMKYRFVWYFITSVISIAVHSNNTTGIYF